MLRVRDLEVDYDGSVALAGVCLEVDRGEIVALVGANGAGKTSLLSALAGFVTPSAGTIDYDGRGIMGLPADRVSRLGIALVPEGRRLFPRLPVWRNLLLGAYHKRDPRFRESTLRKVFELFPILESRQRQAAGTLSGGEQQMLAIGRALMSGPNLLLLDEPSLGIAPMVVARIFEALTEINRLGITILLVEQRLQQALELAARGYVIQTGRIVLTGSGGELLKEDRVRRAYMGI